MTIIRMEEQMAKPLVMRKRAIGNDFATAKPGWHVVDGNRGNQYWMRIDSFNQRSGLTTYLLMVVFDDGSQETTWVHSISAAADYFSSFAGTEVMIEGNAK